MHTSTTEEMPSGSFPHASNTKNIKGDLRSELSFPSDAVIGDLECKGNLFNKYKH